MSSGFRDWEIGTNQKENAGIRICCMETGKNDKILCNHHRGGRAGCPGCDGVRGAALGPIGAGASEYSDPSYDGRGGPCVFLEPVLSGRREREKPGTGSHRGVRGSGTGSGNRAVYLVPPYFPALAVSGIYMAVLILAGETASPAVLRRKAAFRSHSLFAAYIHVPCAGKRPVDGFGMPLYPFTGHGGLMLWRGLAAVMALTAVVLEILWGRRNKQVLPGHG